jgi:hypothetical protein
MRIGIGIVAIAAMIAGCTASSSGPEQAMAPAAGGQILTYEVHSMTDFDAAKSKSESVCRAQYGAPAHYLDRTSVGPTADTVRFECRD